MESTAWKLDERWAKLRLRAVAATVDLTEPNRGLHELWVDEKPWHAARLLEVGIGSVASTAAPAPFDAYVRGSDLVVTYEQSEARPVRAQVYWRGEVDGAYHARATFDLVLSVQTSLLDSDAQLTVGSVVPAAECLRLLKPEEGLFEQLVPWAHHGQESGFSWAASKQMIVERFNGAGCFLFRPPESDLSYVEMVHPVDFSASLLDAVPRAQNTPAKRRDSGPERPHLEGHFEIRHRLFAQRLEKGVILRARVRGVLIPRREDATAAAALYRDFAAAEPPLTT